jgi:hypothetical protein
MDFDLCDSHTDLEYMLFLIAFISEIAPFIAKKCGFKSNGILQLFWNICTSECCRKKKNQELEMQEMQELEEEEEV